MSVQAADVLSHHLKPLCPRDNHVMKFESEYSRLNPERQGCYHCRLEGCSVRYDTSAGYYTVFEMDGQTYRLEEPGVNTMQCPIHHAWLFRREDPEREPGARWSCGVESCNYSFDAPSKGEWVRT